MLEKMWCGQSWRCLPLTKFDPFDAHLAGCKFFLEIWDPRCQEASEVNRVTFDELSITIIGIRGFAALEQIDQLGVGLRIVFSSAADA